MLPPSRSRNNLVHPVLKGTISHRISISITPASGGSKPPPYVIIMIAYTAKQSFSALSTFSAACGRINASDCQKSGVIPSQCAHSDLRAAFGGCALHAACGPCGVGIPQFLNFFGQETCMFLLFMGWAFACGLLLVNFLLPFLQTSLRRVTLYCNAIYPVRRAMHD